MPDSGTSPRNECHRKGIGDDRNQQTAALFRQAAGQAAGQVAG